MTILPSTAARRGACTRPALFLALWLSALAAHAASPSGLRFNVTIAPSLAATPQDGRLFVILDRSDDPEPRFALDHTGPNIPPVLARDVSAFAPGTAIVVDESAFAFPITNLAALSPGDYYVQALFDSNTDLRSPNAPGNLYSKPQRVQVNGARNQTVALELAQRVPPEQLPAETSLVKFVKIRSGLLSQFHRRPIFLRAGIILPRDYHDQPSRRYPLWVRIGGLNTRYADVNELMAEQSEFRKTWLDAGTPALILLQLDGAGPYGDPYQVNSANNGPYGDALVQELIPFVESHFRALAQPHARFLSGTSTGGWVSLALQVFYPDFFNGAWSSCPDPVDFRAFELVNIYRDDNAYADPLGNERPSERDAQGNVILTMRQEVGLENLLGPANSFTRSGQQWGEWNAVFSPRGPDALPLPLWDPKTGKIDHAVARQWEKYDLRLVLEQNWTTLGPKLRGKLHLAAGESDQFFLNNAAHLLGEFLSRADPPFGGKVVFGPGKLHGWMDLSLREMLQAMSAAAGSDFR
ncbi:MAG: alpha/beta hydrolase-fold protein [Limisphaerales bacterium]